MSLFVRRYLEHDESALQQYLQAEKRYAEKQMQPLAALQRQLHTEMAQNLPDDQVLQCLGKLVACMMMSAVNHD